MKYAMCIDTGARSDRAKGAHSLYYLKSYAVFLSGLHSVALCLNLNAFAAHATSLNIPVVQELMLYPIHKYRKTPACP